MPEYDTVPCPKCASMATQTTNERSGALGRPMLVWRCRTCGKVAYDSAAQQLLSQQRAKKNEQQKEQPMAADTTTQPAVQPTEQAPATTIDAIKARVQALQSHAGRTNYAGQVVADNLALLAEVERLQQVQPKRDYYASLGAAQERAAVVTWLRACEDESCVFADDIASQFAAEIERGEHRREEKE